MHGNKRILKDFWDNLIVFFVAALLFVGTICVLSVFGGKIVSYFGGTYNSFQSVVAFFLVGAIVSWPINLAAEAIPKMLCYDKKLISKRQAGVIYIALATAATSVGLFIVDANTNSVRANGSSILLVSLLIALITCKAFILCRPEDT
jgi:hypothetical protein